MASTSTSVSPSTSAAAAAPAAVAAADDDSSKMLDDNDDGSQNRHQDVLESKRIITNDTVLHEKGGFCRQWLEVRQKIDLLEASVRKYFGVQVASLYRFENDEQAVKKIFDACVQAMTAVDASERRNPHSADGGDDGGEDSSSEAAAAKEITRRMQELHAEVDVDFSVLIVCNFVVDMRKWHTHVVNSVRHSIDMGSCGEKMERDLQQLATYVDMRIKKLVAIMRTPSREQDRLVELFNSFPLLARDDSNTMDRMWRLFVAWSHPHAPTTTDGDEEGATCLVSSINYLSKSAMLPVDSKGAKLDCATDENFRRYLKPDMWTPVYSAHLTSALSYQHQNKDMMLWRVHDMARLADAYDESDTTAPHKRWPCMFDVFSLALLNMYEHSGESDAMPAYPCDVATTKDIHVIDDFEDSRLTFRALCRSHIYRRKEYICRQLEPDEITDDTADLDLVDDLADADEALQFDAAHFEDMNEQSLMSMIDETYDLQSSANKYGRADMEERALKQKGKMAESTVSSSSVATAAAAAAVDKKMRARENRMRELAYLDELLNKLMQLDCLAHIKPLQNVAPISINTWLYLPRATIGNVTLTHDALHRVLVYAVDERLDTNDKIRRYLEAIDDGVAKLDLTAVDDDEEATVAATAADATQ